MKFLCFLDFFPISYQENILRALFLRLSIAVLLSLITLVLTWWWYEQTLPNLKSTVDGKPIAFVGKMVNDVLKRPADRLLWQNAETNEPLYNGEAIRTPMDSNVQILFEGSGRILDIEPGSLIIIQKNEGQIALDLMEGTIQVAQNKNQDTSSELVLKSEGGQIDLTQASVSLSKNAKTGLSLEVLEGTASLKTKDGKNQIIQSGETGRVNDSGYDIKQNEIKLLKPNKIVEINEDSFESVEFAWSGIPAKSQIGLWIGTKRSSMTEELRTQEKTAAIELKANTKYFWKIVVYDENLNVTTESSTAQFETRLKMAKEKTIAAPTLIFPANKSRIEVNTNPQIIHFKWSDLPKNSKSKFTLSKSSDLSAPLLVKEVTSEKSLEFSIETGIYFWQLSSSGFQSSSISQFELFKSKKLLEQETRAVQISWNTVDDPIQFFYVNDPKINLAWSHTITSQNQFKIPRWKVDLKNKKTSELTSHISSVPQIGIPAEPGVPYAAVIQAFDENEKLVGTSESRSLFLSSRPLLNSPQLIAERGPINANPDGSLQISWQKINEAKEYELQLFDKAGKLKNKKRYQGNQTSIKNLLPGEYRIRILSVDQFSRLSDPLPAKAVLVPAKSGLRAPSSIRTKVQGQRGSE